MQISCSAGLRQIHLLYRNHLMRTTRAQECRVFLTYPNESRVTQVFSDHLSQLQRFFPVSFIMNVVFIILLLSKKKSCAAFSKSFQVIRHQLVEGCEGSVGFTEKIHTQTNTHTDRQSTVLRNCSSFLRQLISLCKYSISFSFTLRRTWETNNKTTECGGHLLPKKNTQNVLLFS